MTEPHEPSYYEIALTNRQVLVAFVILLLCVVAAFVGGVWLGRNGDGPGAAATVAEATEPGDLADLEEFKFFSEEEGGEEGNGVDPPDLGRVRAEGSPPPPPPAQPPSTQASRTLAEDVGRRPPPPTSPPPPPPTSPPPTPQAATPPPPPPAVAGGFVIQVFSSRDRAQAEKVRADLAGGGHRAFLSPVEVGSTTMYRVRIGPFADRAEAERSARAINRKFKLDTWITSN